MKNIKIIAAALYVTFLICSYLPANAQTQSLQFGLNYNYGIPTGHFNKVVSNSSPRGFMANLMYPFTDKIAAGISFGFQDFYQKYPRALYHLSNNQSISAVLSNSVQTTPIVIKAKYFPVNSPYLRPYVSVAAGTNIIDYRQYYGEFGNFSQSNFGFRAEGGLGVMVPFKKTGASGLNIGANYDYEPYHRNNVKDLSSINFQAGIEIQLK